MVLHDPSRYNCTLQVAQQERRIYTIYIAPVLNAEFHFHMSQT